VNGVLRVLLKNCNLVAELAGEARSTTAESSEDHNGDASPRAPVKPLHLCVQPAWRNALSLALPAPPRLDQGRDSSDDEQQGS
jgi:hypothetical protein